MLEATSNKFERIIEEKHQPIFERQEKIIFLRNNARPLVARLDETLHWDVLPSMF